MYRKTEYLCVFLTGGAVYGCLELMWRGYTHWSMTLAGGICLLLIHLLNMRLGCWNFFLRCVLFSLVITTVEFAAGVVVNLMLGLDVWDYSSIPGNILGQICPAFTLLWLVISVPAGLLSYTARGFFEMLGRRETADREKFALQ